MRVCIDWLKKKAPYLFFCTQRWSNFAPMLQSFTEVNHCRVRNRTHPCFQFWLAWLHSSRGLRLQSLWSKQWPRSEMITHQRHGHDSVARPLTWSSDCRLNVCGTFPVMISEVFAETRSPVGEFPKFCDFCEQFRNKSIVHRQSSCRNHFTEYEI